MFKVDFEDGSAVTWSKDNDGSVETERYSDYRPRFYINGDNTKLLKSRPWIASRDKVCATKFEEWKPTLSEDRQRVLRIDVKQQGDIRSVVTDLKKNFDRSTFRFYNVGLSPQFRFCLQNKVKPLPKNQLEKVELKLSRKDIADRRVSGLKVNDQFIGDNCEEVLSGLENIFSNKDPDIVVVNRGQVLKVLKNYLEDRNFSLGRSSSVEKLAGDNTVSSYGKTIHSNARYNIPGRMIIDRSNSFLLKDTNIKGMWGLVERSFRPLQELAWGSIGRLLTSIEVRRAYLEEQTLTPWKNWDGESFKKASTMHKADRGGFIFNPEPGVHRDVYEADFASLFPNIMVKKNISPETVCCSCCSNEEVPELDYSICENQRGFISQVLKPLVEDRQDLKDRIKEEDLSDSKAGELQGRVDAIKWLLVSCFGYMGHCHASYGAIECHQAIQAFDREIMVKTKEIFEQNGYRIVHGIIDSIWVKKTEDAEDFEAVCREISEEIGIELEPEHHFEWVGFVPRSSSDANISTLNRYFGMKKDESGFKKAGIETEQSSTPEFVKKSQEKMLKAFNKSLDVKDVFKVLKRQVEKLKSEKVDPKDLVIEKKCSKNLEEYQVKNRSFAALKRNKRKGVNVNAGQKVNYIVRDDDAKPLDRVRLGFELHENMSYDIDFYTNLLVKACESIVSCKGLNRENIRRRLRDDLRTSLRLYT